MKIIISDEGCKIVSRNQEMDLRLFLRLLQKERGLTASNIERLAAIDHPSYYDYVRGKTERYQWGLIALQSLGYEIYLLEAPK